MPRSTKPFTPELLDGPFTRRDWMEWIGKGVAIGLFSPLIQACADALRLQPGDVAVEAGGDAGADGTADPAPVEVTPEDVAACEKGTFLPGGKSQPVFQNWAENTVDPQDVAKIVASWTLTIDGLAAKPRTFTFCELRDLGLVREVMDFHCVEGWDVLDVPWDGLPLGKLIDLVEPQADAKYLKITAIDGKYTESLSLDIAREPHSLLGLGVGGDTLPLAHGFPCRIVVPRLMGYKNAKYVQHIELVAADTKGFWEGFGYPSDAPVQASRLREGKY